MIYDLLFQEAFVALQAEQQLAAEAPSEIYLVDAISSRVEAEEEDPTVQVEERQQQASLLRRQQILHTAATVGTINPNDPYRHYSTNADYKAE